MPDLKIDMRWSLGHTDIIGGEVADKAAKAGVRLPSLIFRTHSYTGMSSKMRAQTRWREEWSEEKVKRLIGNTPSGFELADVHPPKISPNEYFRPTPQELFGRLTQTLTGHGYTGDYYRRFVPSETAWCRRTDTEIQHILKTRDHILLMALHKCDRYAHQRPLLENRPTSLLFSSRSGVLSLVLFMRKSGAFTKLGHPHPDPVIHFAKKPRDPKPP
jgi:hypothetical protein